MNMSRHLRIAGAKAAALATFLAPFVALAQAPTAPVAPVQTYDQIIALLDKATNWLFAILIAVAIIFILVAAFRYLTAGGDPEKVGKANHALIFAAVAVAVAIVAKAIPILVKNFIG